MEKEFNVYELIDKKIRIETERYEESCITVIIFTHIYWQDAKYTPYLVYKNFPAIPLGAVVTNHNINDLNIINSLDPHFFTAPWYQEIAELIIWDWELAQNISAFKFSKMWYWPTEEEFKALDALQEKNMLLEIS